MKFLIAILAVLAVALNAVAAPTKTKSENTSSAKSLSTLSDIHKKLKESAYKMSFSQYHYLGSDNEGDIARSDFILNDTFLSYNINRQNDVRFMTRATTAISERSQAEHQWRWVELRYRRNRILTEDKNWLNFSAEVRGDYIPDEKRRNQTVTNGFVRPQINFSKNFTKSFSTDLSIFSLINDRKSGKGRAGARIERSDRVVFSPNYMVNDKLTLSLGMTYIHDVYLDTPQNRNPSAGEFATSDYWWTNPAANYVFTNWFNMDIDFGATTNTSHDRKFWIKNMQAQYWAGISFNIQVF